MIGIDFRAANARTRKNHKNELAFFAELKQKRQRSALYKHKEAERQKTMWSVNLYSDEPEDGEDYWFDTEQEAHVFFSGAAAQYKLIYPPLTRIRTEL